MTSPLESGNASMSTNSGAVLLIALACLLPADLTAHGGQYRGPTLGPLTPSGPGGPSQPGSVMGGPLTGGHAGLDVSSWRVWWELNHERYLRGARGAGVSAGVRESVVSPSLARALERTNNADVNSACLIALAKSGGDTPDAEILDVIRARLTRSHIEVREAAVLAMGILGNSDAFDDLDALVRNTRRGRQVVGRDNIGDRVRTFAAYALGLLVNRSEDAALKGKVLDSLLATLQDSQLKDRDVLTGVLNAIRLVNLDAADGAAHKRVLWKTLAALEDYQGRRFTDQRAGPQSHVLTAIAALAGRGDGLEQQRAKALVADQLGRPRLDAMVYRSATIALGQMLAPEDDDYFEILARRVAQPPDPLVRKLGMIAFGEIGGEAAFQQLRAALRGNRRDVQAWAAIGLGVLGHNAPKKPATTQRPNQANGLRAATGKLLLSSLRKNRDKDVQAAIAIGLGMAGYREAAADIRKLLEKYMKLGEFSGHLCVSLALLDDTKSIPLIQQAMATIDQPVLYGHAALALARLDQLDASSTAISALRGGQLKMLPAAAAAIGHLRNPNDVAALSQMIEGVKKKQTTDIANLRVALAAAALGSVADLDPVGFGARVARGMNYTANVQTISNGSYGILDIF